MKNDNPTKSSNASKPLLAAVLRILNPSYSYCMKCKFPWNHCKSKSVYTTEHNGTFATCKECWDNSSLTELKKYYTQVYKKQEKSMLHSNYKLEHSLEHLLNCVENEYVLENRR